jgi:hypothetical protein
MSLATIEAREAECDVTVNGEDRALLPEDLRRNASMKPILPVASA